MSSRGLPDVDYSQPDCFETEDVDEENVALPDDSTSSKPNENIDETAISAASAFSNHSGKAFTPSNRGFCDSIDRVRPNLFECGSESVGKKALESPVETFQRIKAEIKLLGDDLQSIAKMSEGDGSSFIEQSVSTDDLLSGLKALEYSLEQLGAIKADSSSAPKLTSIEAVQAHLSQKLVEDLALVSKQSVPTSGKAEDGDGKAVPHHTYEIYLEPNTLVSQGQSSGDQLGSVSAAPSTGVADASVVAAFEQRLSVLENAIHGSSPLDSNLSETISKLEKKVSSLDAQKLALLESRVASLPDLSNQESLSLESTKALEQLNKWDGVVDMLPALVERLQTLKAVHMKGLHCKETLEMLQSDQSSIQSLLSEDKSKMLQLEATIKENAKIIEQNFQKMEARMKALEKKN